MRSWVHRAQAQAERVPESAIVAKALSTLFDAQSAGPDHTSSDTWWGYIDVNVLWYPLVLVNAELIPESEMDFEVNREPVQQNLTFSDILAG